MKKKDRKDMEKALRPALDGDIEGRRKLVEKMALAAGLDLSKVPAEKHAAAIDAEFERQLQELEGGKLSA